MKKYLIILVLALLSVISFADNGNKTDAVSMVSFEQRWLDNEATLALKNNTNEEIHNVQYVIEYLDMKGKQLDYAEYTSDVDIAPGMTRKVNIPAYEHKRSYSYYLSEASISEPHKFKVNYKYISCNQKETAENYQETDEYQSSEGEDWYFGTTGVIIVCAMVLFGLGIAVGLYVLVAVIANRNNRNVIIWLLLSFIASPLLILIILLCIGKAETKEIY